MLKRAAIYARFSSDRQRDRSIDDQIALCHALAERSGWTVTSVYADYAASGSTVHRRPEFSRMLADAEHEQFDVVVAEDIDRLARGEGDAPKLRQRLEFLGVEIHTCTDGHITKLCAGLKGLMSSLFLDNLIAHSKRGMAGVVRDGRHPGGRAYGYRTIAGRPGELEIMEDEAAVVRRIFERYVDGQTPRQIAGDLNSDRVPPPRRGATWSASTINGNTKRHNGILQNELYAGVIIWNKVKMVRDPSTGRRVIRPNDSKEHQRVDAPRLRIVSTSCSMQPGRSKPHAPTPAITCNAERKKASTSAGTQTADAQRKLAAAERELRRAIDGMIRGTISGAEGDQVIPELRRQRDKLAAELEATAKPPKVVELYPPSVDAYLAAINKLADYANGHLVAHDDELAQCLRKFLDSVTVMPARRGEQPEIRLAGGLASLLPPNKQLPGIPGTPRPRAISG